MVSTLHLSATTSAASPTPWCTRIVKRRVHITFALAATLICYSLFAGVEPHDLTSARDVHAWAGVALVLAGLAIRSWAAGTLHKDAEVTTVGPYSLVRNPLYIGSMLMIVGFCILIGQEALLLLIVPTFAVLFAATVSHEERALAKRFGAAWHSYAATTPRFFPRRMIPSGSHWSLKQWRKNREYQAAVATILGLLGLQLWQQL